MEMTYRREQSAGYLTNLAARLFVRAIERRLAGGNAGPMPVFFALAEGGTLSQATLARQAMVEQPTMANTLNRMERDGLIERTPDPDDRRSALIRLTPLGLQRAHEGLAAGMEVNGAALSGFTPAERDLYLEMLRRVAANLERDGEAR
jgi:MarR family transcriptional regulator for hemolysin